MQRLVLVACGTWAWAWAGKKQACVPFGGAARVRAYSKGADGILEATERPDACAKRRQKARFRWMVPFACR